MADPDTSVSVMLIEGIAFTVIVILAVLEHPDVVPVTVYVVFVVGEGLMEVVVVLVLHK